MNTASSADGWSGGCPPLDLLEQSATSDPAGALREHLSRCGRCSRTMERIRADNALLAELVSANTDRLSDEHAGRTVEGYEILGELERGGQGVVYRAVQTATRRPVALKMLLLGSSATARQRRRFEREVEIAAGLRHPNIVTVYDSGRTAGGGHYLAMEYVDGLPLDLYMSGVVPRAAADLRAALEVFVRVCDAVTAAHQRGVIHRDLKPGNILVGADGQPRVLDFGLARHAPGWSGGGPAATLTAEGEFCGTVAYAAPEHLTAKPEEIDVRGDVYSLGVILYEMLTGVRPYRKPMLADLILAIRSEEPADPRSLNRAIDDELRTIILHAMAKDPARRYQSAGALLDDLRHYQRGEAINAKRDSRWYLLRKMLAAHRAAVAATAALLLFAVGLGVVMTVLYQRALTAEQAALLRGAQLAQVADFQAAQLAGIDVPLMAQRLRADLVERTRGALARRGLTAEEVEAGVAHLERVTAGVNFTDGALRLLDENIFDRAREAIDRRFADQPLVRARLLQTLSLTLRDLGLLDGALAPQEEALAIRRRDLGDEHPDTLESLHAAGALLRQLGRFEEARAFLVETIERRRELLGAQHPETLNSVNSLASVLQAQGKLEEAGPYFREALEGRRRALGDEHPDTLNSINNMGGWLQAQRRLAEALPLFSEVLEARRRTLGGDDRRTLGSISNLGGVLRDMGSLDEAEPLHREALDGYRRVLGNEHPHTLLAVYNMGGLLRMQGRFAEAEEFVREALEGNRQTLGPDHPQTLRSLASLGVILRSLDRTPEAVACFRETVEGRRRLHGDHHAETVSAMLNLSVVLRETGALDDAERAGGEAVRGALEGLPAGHPTVGVAFSEAGRTLAQMERFAEAEAAMLEAHARLVAAVGPRDGRTTGAINWLAELYESWHAADPGSGHDAEAVRWRRTLDDVMLTAADGASPGR